MRLNFVETLRQKRKSLRGPTSEGFDQQVWKQAFLAQRDGSPADHHVYLLGIAIGAQCGRVQASIDELASHLRFRKLDELAPSFSARINQVHVEVFRSLGKALETVDVVSIEQVQQMRCFTDSAGNSHALSGAIEAVVDAIGGMLKLLRRDRGFGKLGIAQPEDIAFDVALDRLMALAQHDVSIRRVWNSVVWWKSTVAVTPDCLRYAVDDSASDLALRAAIDLARSPALMARDFANFRKSNPAAPNGNVYVPWVQLHDGRLTVRRVPAFQVPDGEREQLLEARRACGLFQVAALGDFLDEIHPQVGLQIREILLVWGELAMMAGQLHELARPLDKVKDAGALATIVESRLPREEIASVIRQCVVLSADRVRECIDFLCHTPASKRATLWDRPLLPAGSDVVLLWWPLVGAHHARVLNAWAKDHRELGITFGRKGTANEAILVQAVREAIAKNPYRDRMRFIGSSFRPRHRPGEQIDLLIVIDDAAFVIETASIPCPAEPREFRDTEARLDEKARQCRAQCSALACDLDQIAEWAGDDGYRGRVKRVFGVVATNSYLRDGFPHDGVCFCHVDTLFNVLAGAMYFGVLRGGREVTLEAAVQPVPQGSYADGMIAALRKSPKAEFYARCTVQTDYRIKGFDDTDVEGLHRTVNMDMPSHDMLERRLRECSFARTLEEVADPRFD